MFVPQAEEPVAMRGADCDLALAVDGLAGYAQVPVGLRPHVNLPVVTARCKALLGQDADDAVKAPRRVWHWLVAVTAMNPLVVSRENQPRVSGGRVKGHIFWARAMTESEQREMNSNDRENEQLKMLD